MTGRARWPSERCPPTRARRSAGRRGSGPRPLLPQLSGSGGSGSRHAGRCSSGQSGGPAGGGRRYDRDRGGFERDQALEQLDGLLAEASWRRGRLVLVRGEAGIGKSTLVEAFAAGRSSRVLWGICDPVVPPRPLAPIFDIAEQVGGPLRSALADPDRHRILSAFLGLLRAEGGPWVVVLEDVQWADEATLEVLRVVGRRAAQLRALVDSHVSRRRGRAGSSVVGRRSETFRPRPRCRCAFRPCRSLRSRSWRRAPRSIRSLCTRPRRGTRSSSPRFWPPEEPNCPRRSATPSGPASGASRRQACRSCGRPRCSVRAATPRSCVPLPRHHRQLSTSAWLRACCGGTGRQSSSATNCARRAVLESLTPSGPVTAPPAGAGRPARARTVDRAGGAGPPRRRGR